MAADCEVFARVVKVGTEAEVCIRLVGGDSAPAAAGRLAVRFFSKVNRTEDERLDAACDADGVIRCGLQFRTVGEYVLDVLPAEGAEPIAGARVFAIPPAMAGLRPYKGDLHMHTTASDGTRSPLEMAIAARDCGMDFIAVTDHDCHAPSLQAAAEADEAGLDLLCLPGEEVTVAEIGGHVLSLGASAGVAEQSGTDESRQQRRRILRDEIAGRDLQPPLTGEQYAHAVWTVREVRRLGGRALLAHPFWEGTTRKYYPPRALVEQLLRDGFCDGVELLGGSPSREGNRLAVAKYCQEAHRGRVLPVIGGSDAHVDADPLGRYWTVVFAPRLDAAAVLDALADLRSVACERLDERDAAIYGPLAWVEYAYFLHREFFPLHDRICRLEAELHRRAGETDTRAAGATLRDEMRALRRAFWDRSTDGEGEAAGPA